MGVNAVFHYVPLHSSPAGRRYGRASGALDTTDDVVGDLSLAEFVTANGFDLYSKNDMRFMESVFKMLVTHFAYKPALSIK